MTSCGMSGLDLTGDGRLGSAHVGVRSAWAGVRSAC
jgi:hypothetical protein